MTATAIPRNAVRRVSDESPRFYTYADIQAITRLSLAEVSHLSLRGVLPGRVEFGRAVRHERAVVDRWLAEKVRGGAA